MKNTDETFRQQVRAIEAHAAERTNGNYAEQIAIISKAQALAIGLKADDWAMGVLAIAKRRIIRKA